MKVLPPLIACVLLTGAVCANEPPRHVSLAQDAHLLKSEAKRYRALAETPRATERCRFAAKAVASNLEYLGGLAETAARLERSGTRSQKYREVVDRISMFVTEHARMMRAVGPERYMYVGDAKTADLACGILSI